MSSTTFRAQIGPVVANPRHLSAGVSQGEAPGDPAYTKQQRVDTQFPGHPYLVVALNLLVIYWVIKAFYPDVGAGAVNIAAGCLLVGSVIFCVLDFVLYPLKRVRRIDTFSAVLLLFFLTWCVVTVARGFTGDTSKLLTLVANPYLGGLVWLVPLATYVGSRPGTLRSLMPSFRLHSVIGGAIAGWGLVSHGMDGNSEVVQRYQVALLLFYAVPVVLVTGMGNLYDRAFFILLLCIETVAQFKLSNRADFVLCLLYLALAVSLPFVRNVQQFARWVLAAGAVGGVGLYFLADLIIQSVHGAWAADTRSFLIREMTQGFSTTDWIIGRGALGSYFSEYFRDIATMGLKGDSMNRQVNEIGYLHIILKMGLVGAILYVLVAARAAIKAFGMKNRLGIGIMFIIIIHLLEMLVVGQAVYSPYRFTLWILIGIVLSTPQRRGAYRR